MIRGVYKPGGLSGWPNKRSTRIIGTAVPRKLSKPAISDGNPGGVSRRAIGTTSWTALNGRAQVIAPARKTRIGCGEPHGTLIHERSAAAGHNFSRPVLDSSVGGGGRCAGKLRWPKSGFWRTRA